MDILFVENHDVFARTVVGQFLRGHRVEVVSTLAAARQRLEVRSFDVVLVDHDLNDGAGVELVAELRRAGNRLPIIGVSARPEGNEALEAAGANAVLSKLEFHRIGTLLGRLVG